MVECGSLENYFRVTPNGGSNPPLSVYIGKVKATPILTLLKRSLTNMLSNPPTSGRSKQLYPLILLSICAFNLNSAKGKISSILQIKNTSRIEESLHFISMDDAMYLEVQALVFSLLMSSVI